MAAENAEQFDDFRLKVWEVLKDSLALYRGNFPLFVGIAAIGQALIVLRHLLMASGGGALWWAAQTLLLPALVVAFWAGAAMILAASSRLQGKDTGVKDCFAGVEGRFLRYVIANALYLLAWIAGLLLLVLPGFYILVVFSLAACVAVLEQRHVASCLRRSRQLIRGSFWRVLVIVLILMVLFLPGVLVSRLLLPLHMTLAVLWLAAYWVFLWPFWTAARVVLYYRLRESKEGAGPPAEPAAEKEGTGCLFAILTAIALIIAIAGLIAAWAMGLSRLVPPNA